MFRITFLTRAMEQAEFALEELGACAVYMVADGLLPDPRQPNKPQYGDTIEALFQDEPMIETLKAFAEGDILVEPIEARDWVRESQANLPLVVAPPFSVFGAHARPATRQTKHEILLEAGAAFGSGHHATTQGCLTLIGRLPPHLLWQKCLDIGSGSGILAIALARMNYASIIASDIDPIAARTTLENARINKCHTAIQALYATGFNHNRIRSFAPYAVITANILAGPLCQMARDFAAHLHPDGHLIVSGLLIRQVRMVRSIFRVHGLILHDRVENDDWASLTFRHCSAGVRRV